MRHHILEHRIRHIADEQVVLGMASGKERLEARQIRGISFHGPSFGGSGTDCQDSGDQLPTGLRSGDQVPPTRIRGISYQKLGFSYRDSGYQVPNQRSNADFSGSPKMLTGSQNRVTHYLTHI